VARAGGARRARSRQVRARAALLDFTQARLGAGLRVLSESVDLHALIAEAVDELAHPSRAIRHLRNGSGECDADPGRLEQLVGNLVANALRYGAQAKPVTVTSTIDADSFSIAVHNHGTPILPDVMPSLFQPMTRGVKATSSERSVGLGLFIVAAISRAHGGSTRVESSADAGTTFLSRFPRRR
jgi:sigma-B regulation protein RsbU (phosphoserine phosphatase)